MGILFVICPVTTFSFLFSVMGNKYAQTGNLDMAVKYFTDAIKHNPQEVK